eukprot:gnl/TRDRNA2_/TRDRNA2_183586_c0_seq1.p1 gnl/TRDRNA2_/TRDRNA2_183586_c0~~gnl/TRDRNA2_/TRDRNA2_183586_c0_seq1.p1  ORF type:complete len:389 (+),score=63.59 gnl/TRDRNA2_/TRDRNA2_183586_c0_seq1:80-1246(+)
MQGPGGPYPAPAYGGGYGMGYGGGPADYGGDYGAPDGSYGGYAGYAPSMPTASNMQHGQGYGYGSPPQPPWAPARDRMGIVFNTMAELKGDQSMHCLNSEHCLQSVMPMHQQQQQQPCAAFDQGPYGAPFDPRSVASPMRGQIMRGPPAMQGQMTPQPPPAPVGLPSSNGSFIANPYDDAGRPLHTAWTGVPQRTPPAQGPPVGPYGAPPMPSASVVCRDFGGGAPPGVGGGLPSLAPPAHMQFTQQDIRFAAGMNGQMPFFPERYQQQQQPPPSPEQQGRQRPTGERRENRYALPPEAKEEDRQDEAKSGDASSTERAGETARSCAANSFKDSSSFRAWRETSDAESPRTERPMSTAQFTSGNSPRTPRCNQRGRGGNFWMPCLVMC